MSAFDYPYPQKSPVIEVYLFDEENVAIQKTGFAGRVGEVTGIKGDAFRIVISVDASVVAKTKKLAIRPTDKDK